MTTATAARPAWMEALATEYRCGTANTFLLYGNVHDYIDHPTANITLVNFLEEVLGKSCSVATYAPDRGIRFPGAGPIQKESRLRFIANVFGVKPKTEDDEPTLPSEAPRAVPLLLDYACTASDKDGLVLKNGESRKAAVIVDRMDLIAPPADKGTLSPAQAGMLAGLHRIGSATEISERMNLVVLLAPSLEEIHPDLRQASASIHAIEVDPPDYDQRLAFATRALERREVRLDGITIQELAASTAGLNRRHIEDIILRAVGNDGTLTRALVRERKAGLMATEYAEVLTVLEPDVTFAMVGGHDLAKRYLREEVIPTLLDEEQIEDAPMGILFSGPSGTGKTWLSRALGAESGLNFLALDADKIRGSYVGESERKLAKALRGVVAMAPCILFIDELDQKVKRVTNSGGGGGDSVESNIFGKLLEFLSDTSHRGRILLVAASNRPDLIDAALQRPGRIDAKIPLLPPDTAEERADALVALMDRFGMEGQPSRDELVAIGRATDLWTQAELEGLVVKARGIARRRKTTLTLAFANALGRMRRSTADVDLHIQKAIAASDDIELVPERYRPMVGREAAMEEIKQAEAAPAPPRERGSVAPAALFGDFGDEE